MKKHLFSLFFFFTVSVFVVGKPKKNSVPEWMDDLHKFFPQNKYISYLSEGSSLLEAQTNGQLGIARYFDSNVQLSTQTFQKISQNEETTKNQKELTVNSSISSDVELFAVHFSESFKNKKEKKIYLVAYINRDEAFEVFRPKLDYSANNFENLFLKGKKALESENPLIAAVYFKNASFYSKEFEEKYQFARLINISRSQEYENIHLKCAKLDALFLESLQKSSLKITVLNDTENIILTKAKNLFGEYGFSVSESSFLYEVCINVLMNEETLQKGSAYYPSMNISILKNGEGIISFGKKGKKVTAATKNVAKMRTMKVLEKLMEELFNQEFYTIN